jgi:hypothetical protein
MSLTRLSTRMPVAMTRHTNDVWLFDKYSRYASIAANRST